MLLLAKTGKQTQEHMWAELRRGAENESDLEHVKLQMCIHPSKDSGIWKLATIEGRL